MTKKKSGMHGTIRLNTGELFVGYVSGENSAAALKTARVVYENFRITRVLFDEIVSGYSERFRVSYSRRNYKVYGIPKLLNRKTEILTIQEDRRGDIIITSNQDTGDVFLQFEADKELIYDLLRKGERKDLENGWKVEIKGNEPRASIIGELWEAQNGGN